MGVEFRELNESNYEECIGLRVREDQKFVASNLYSLAEAKIFPQGIPMAIYADGTMVGFVMYILDLEAGELYLWRFMIDQRYQGKGYGVAALDLLKGIALERAGIRRMRLSTQKDNVNGIRIYEKFGFVDTGTLEEGEEVFVLELGKSG